MLSLRMYGISCTITSVSVGIIAGFAEVHQKGDNRDRLALVEVVLVDFDSSFGSLLRYPARLGDTYYESIVQGVFLNGQGMLKRSFRSLQHIQRFENIVLA